MTNPMYVLWATPRTTSTAFEWMMRMRGDLATFHEPFGQPWYQGDTAAAPRSTDKPRIAGLTHQSVFDRLCEVAETMPVFIKDFPQYCEPIYGDPFFNAFTHSFLIRDPAKVMASMHRSYVKTAWAEVFTDKEIGVSEQRQLFDLLTDRLGFRPTLIDSDDLLADPHAMVAAYCDSIGIPFIEEALSWQPGSRSEVLWYDSDDSVWHAALRDSDGLRAQPRADVCVDQLPSDLRQQYRLFLPHYEYLYQFRLRV